ncbi:type VI secretion system protein VasJ [Paraburkholderia bryophila]|uniref:Type VI secretion system protein VasJ n=2 Tax=Paraburkholderia bryophila TaxID=420952 RepID=A0A7Y9WJW3_9BURK|nr:type VI secretion system protein VasJ [Paraburkholderia bryophila]
MSMLPNLLKGLFPSRDAEQRMRERIVRWDAWLQPIAGGGVVGVGRDPGYEDAFFALKDEVNRLSGIDDALIVATCEQLLKEVGKDLRLAGYYAFARLRQDGPAGFADGLDLAAALIDRFGDALLPARPEAKKAALEWLAMTRIIDPLMSHSEFAPADFERAIAALNLLITATNQWNETARPNLQALMVRFERNDTPGPNLEAGNGTASGGTQTARSTQAARTALTTGSVSSTRELLDQARAMAVYLRDQENGYLPSARLVRGVRWDTLHEPPPADVEARTRLVPPRAELRQQMKLLVLQRQWHELLERVEGAFMEGANHLWLDLQYFQHVALDHIGAPYNTWRELLRADVALFLDRLPGIERLAFNDGTPFADDTAREWIARHAVVRDLEAGEAIAPLPVTAHQHLDVADNWPEIETQARELSTNQTLEAAFVWLESLPGVMTERRRYLQRVVMARLADHAGRAEIAMSLLSELDAAVQSLKLIHWEPALAFDIKLQLLKSLKTLGRRKDADKPALARRVEHLQGELVVLDPARALTLS